MRFSADIEQALAGANGAGWTVNMSSVHALGLAVAGVVVELKENASASNRAAAAALVEALTAERVAAAGPVPEIGVTGMVTGRQDDNAQITIAIGGKP